MGSALARGGSILEPAGTGSVGRRRSFLQSLTEATHVALSYQNLSVQTQHMVWLKLQQRVHLKLGLEYFIEYVERFSCKGSFKFRSREVRKDIK